MEFLGEKANGVAQTFFHTCTPHDPTRTILGTKAACTLYLAAEALYTQIVSSLSVFNRLDYSAYKMEPRKLGSAYTSQMRSSCGERIVPTTGCPCTVGHLLKIVLAPHCCNCRYGILGQAMVFRTPRRIFSESQLKYDFARDVQSCRCSLYRLDVEICGRGGR